MIVGVDKVADKTFDYVVIGGGTAGLTVARGLSEDPFNSVLVLEAGAAHLHEDMLLNPVPRNVSLNLPSYLWGHRTIPQPNAGGRSIDCQRGKGLGGSSAVNYMAWTRPRREDVNDMERLGNTGWNWETYVETVKKIEGFVQPSERVQKALRLKCDDWDVGKIGPVQLSYPSAIQDDGVRLEEAFLNAGFPVTENPLGGDYSGMCYMPSTLNLHKMVRSYSANTYYAPYHSRRNLRALTGAQVARILTRKSDDGLVVATSVEFVFEGKTYTASVRKEAIVCAGTIQSPQVLELSGIGDPEILRSIGVTPALDLPSVGRNVQEHIHTPITWRLKRPDERIGGSIYPFCFSPLDTVTDKGASIYEKVKECIANVDEKKSPGLKQQYELMAKRFAPGSKAPVFEWIIIPPSMNLASAAEKRVGMMVVVNTLFSRGTIHAKSSDPLESPEIDPQYFAKEIDLDIFIEGLKFARNLATYSPLKDIIDCEAEPGPHVKTDEQLREWVKSACQSCWHTVGSCSMLPRDNGGVVDSDLKVYGTQNIRVADLSVVPLHMSAHTQATAYTIGQRAVSIIQVAAEAASKN